MSAELTGQHIPSGREPGQWALHADPVTQVLNLPRGHAGYARYEQVRALGDLVRGRSPMYMTASHAICSEVLRGDAYGAVPTTVSKRVLQPENGSQERLAHPLDDSFASIDPPEHTRLRKIVAPAFTPRAMNNLRGYVEEVTTQCLERLATNAPVDLIGEFALQIPSQIICKLLGLPNSDHDQFVHWGLEFSAIVDGTREADDLHRTRVLLSEMNDYFRDMANFRRHKPGDDLISTLVAATDNSEMTEIGLIATCESLLIGGFVTTANIIGNAVLALHNHPKQRDAFVAQPELAEAVVEEVLRLEAPAQYSVRITLRPVTLAEQELPAGIPIVTLLAAANRDPQVFARPNQLDIFRPNARDHLSFAAGVHYCIGAGLARLEGAIALRALFQRFPRLEVAEPARYCLSRVIRGPQYLAVRSNQPSRHRAVTTS